MCPAIFYRIVFSDGNSRFHILFLWCHFNYMSLPMQWVSGWLCLQEHLAGDGRRTERYLKFIMTYLCTKHDILEQGLHYCQLVTQTNPCSITRVFLDNPLGKKIMLCSKGQRCNLQVKKWGVDHTVYWETETGPCISCCSEGMGAYLLMR